MYIKPILVAAASIIALTGITSAAVVPVEYRNSSVSRNGSVEQKAGRPQRTRQTVNEAAQVARQLVYDSNLLNLNTINPDGVPVSQVQYYADCLDANADLTMIRMNISAPYKNIARGSPASVSLRVGDRAPDGKQPKSVMASPRVTLYGHFSKMEDLDTGKVTQCMLKQHADAKAWLPGTRIHDGEWVKFTIDKINYIGGFGNVAYIGNIPVDLYRAAKVDTHLSIQQQ